MSRGDVQGRSNSKAFHLGGAGLPEHRGLDKVETPQCCEHQVPVVCCWVFNPDCWSSMVLELARFEVTKAEM